MGQNGAEDPHPKVLSKGMGDLAAALEPPLLSMCTWGWVLLWSLLSLDLGLVPRDLTLPVLEGPCECIRAWGCLAARKQVAQIGAVGQWRQMVSRGADSITCFLF